MSPLNTQMYCAYTKDNDGNDIVMRMFTHLGSLRLQGECASMEICTANTTFRMIRLPDAALLAMAKCLLEPLGGVPYLSSTDADSELVGNPPEDN